MSSHLPRVFAKLAEYDDSADYDEILTIQEPPAVEGEGAGGPSHERGASGASMVPTERRYVRENVSKQSPETQTSGRVAAMYGAGGQSRPQGIGYRG